MYNTYNPYFQPQRFDQPLQNPMQSMQSSLQNRALLNGKSVDSIDVVKAMDIPLDGSVSYFPLTDGSAIVTKQLMNDGTSKTVIYRPVTNERPSVAYVAIEEFNELREEFNSIKKQLKEIKDKVKINEQSDSDN